VACYIISSLLGVVRPELRGIAIYVTKGTINALQGGNAACEHACCPITSGHIQVATLDDGQLHAPLLGTNQWNMTKNNF
jgi:hypothetical protein